MADDQEKTEEATSKKLEDARKEGNVAKSQEVSGALTLIISFLLILSLSGYIKDKVLNFYKYIFLQMHQELNIQVLYQIAIKTIYEVVTMILPIALAIMVSGVAANVMQFGFNFTTKPIMPNFGKLNPIKGLKNLLSFKKLIEGVKILLKTFLVFVIIYVLFTGFLDEMGKVMLFSISGQLNWLERKLIIIFAIVILLFIVFAGLDYMFIKYNYAKNLRMSKQEVKDEFKQMEGDPRVKSRIRQIQMQAARKRMMQDVASADVVITNPTHFAVALRYDKSLENAPVVVAKGADNLALKIKQIAIDNDVMVLERRELARELFKLCEVGDKIPEELFKAVAEVLTFVYKVKGKNIFAK